MRLVEASKTSLEQSTLRYVAEDIWQELNEIERHYPQILDDPSYIQLKTGCQNLAYGKPVQAQVEALESGVRKLISAIAQHEPGYGNVKELSRAQRLEFARRIIKPSLKTIEDRRPTMKEAEKFGLSSLEIKALLMAGHIKPLSHAESVEWHDPDTPIEGREGVTTLGELERLALSHTAIHGQFNRGRTDN